MECLGFMLQFSFYTLYLVSWCFSTGGVQYATIRNPCVKAAFLAEFPRIPFEKNFDVYLLVECTRIKNDRIPDMVVLTKTTVGSVYALLRYWCKRDLQDRPVIPFGGNVYVEKCDESQFKHKSKVSHSST